MTTPPSDVETAVRMHPRFVCMRKSSSRGLPIYQVQLKNTDGKKRALDDFAWAGTEEEVWQSAMTMLVRDRLK